MSKNFVEQFSDALDQLEIDAKRVKMSLTSVCKAANVSRTTPDRWRHTPPNTIAVLAKMQKVVSDKENGKPDAPTEQFKVDL